MSIRVISGGGTSFPLSSNTTLTDTGVTATFGGPILAANGTAAAPAYSFASYPDTGFRISASDRIGIVSNGAEEAVFGLGSLRLVNTQTFGWTSGSTGATYDTILSRKSAGILQMYGATTGEVRVNGDGVTGAEYLSLGHDGTNSTITSTGILNLKGTDTRLFAGGSQRWYVGNVSPTYPLGPLADNAYDVGISSARVKNIHAGNSLQGGGSKALTDATATGFVKIAVAQGTSVGARIRYTVKATDGTDFQIEEGTIQIAAINKAGTVTAATPVVTATTPLVTAGTLAATVFTVAEVDADTITVSADSDTSLSTTSHVIQYFVEMNSANTVTQL